MAEQILVTTPLGSLEGEAFEGLGGTIYCFLGVPYAKPPIGDRRFGNPEPIEAWQGVLDTTSSPPLAPTYHPRVPGEIMIVPGCSEDCLYLNIYTPVVPKPGMKLPVMVYIHEGAFVLGTTNREFLGPDFLVPQGVILVGINYRNFSLGFLSLNTKECSGNWGLKDQSLALRWVRDNISGFGGDPGNVTIFGLSSGAMCCHLHLISPLSRGLFHRAIGLSASALSRYAVSRYPRQSALLLARRLGFHSEDSNEILQHLKSVTFEEIIKHSAKIFGETEGIWDIDDFIDRSFGPTIEPLGTPGAFLTISPKQAVELGLYEDVPAIWGNSSHEGLCWLKDENYVPTILKPADCQMLLPKEIAGPLGSDVMLEAAKMLKDFYFPNGVTQPKYIEALTALHGTYCVFKTVRAHLSNASKKAPHYLYLFTATRDNPTIKMCYDLNSVPGTSHAEEMDYLFTGMIALNRCNPIKENTSEQTVQKLLLKVFTDFAKFGVPSPDWPPATLENNFSYADLSETMVIKDGFGGKCMAFWDSIYDKLEKNKFGLNSKF